jgi:hypothetical protein
MTAALGYAIPWDPTPPSSARTWARRKASGSRACGAAATCTTVAGGEGRTKTGGASTDVVSGRKSDASDAPNPALIPRRLQAAHAWIRPIASILRLLREARRLEGKNP